MTTSEIRLATVTPFCSRRGGGITTALSGLSHGLAAHPGLQFKVFCSDGADLSDSFDLWQGLDIESLRAYGASKYAMTPGLVDALSGFSADLSHLHGLWTGASWFHYRYTLQAKKPYLIAPHGMMDAWALNHSRRLKQVCARVYEREHLERATCLIGLCDPEMQSMRAYGLGNPIAVIPNGIDLPSAQATNLAPKWAGEQRKALLFIGRIHPKKGLPLLLDAWGALKKQNPQYADEWFLAIVGWSEVGHLDELQQQVKDLGIEQDVRFFGALYGEDKEAALRKASAFVLPSYSEGLPMSVLEAWSYRLPTLTTPECNLPEGFEQNAALRIETDVDSIVSGLRGLFDRSPDELDELGERAYQLVERRFTWARVAEQMVSVYSWILGGGDAPGCVRLR